MTASASRIPGNASSTSIARMMSVSRQPPQKPASPPSASPHVSAIPTETTPTRSESRPP